MALPGHARPCLPLRLGTAAGSRLDALRVRQVPIKVPPAASCSTFWLIARRIGARVRCGNWSSAPLRGPRSAHPRISAHLARPRLCPRPRRAACWARPASPAPLPSAADGWAACCCPAPAGSKDLMSRLGGAASLGGLPLPLPDMLPALSPRSPALSVVCIEAHGAWVVPPRRACLSCGEPKCWPAPVLRFLARKCRSVRQPNTEIHV
jgi:hypothetical protein